MNSPDREREERDKTKEGPQGTGRRGRRSDRSLGIIVVVLVALLVAIGVYAWATMDTGDVALDGALDQQTTSAEE